MVQGYSNCSSLWASSYGRNGEGGAHTRERGQPHQEGLRTPEKPLESAFCCFRTLHMLQGHPNCSSLWAPTHGGYREGRADSREWIQPHQEHSEA